MAKIWRQRFYHSDKADNAAATATKAAPGTGKRLVLTEIDASYSAATVGLLQVKDHTTVIWEAHVHNAYNSTFRLGIQATANQKFDVILAASGSGGTDGVVNIAGYTEEV